MVSYSYEIFSNISLSVLSDWLTTLVLVFGGCCSNALTLEQVINEHPNAGTLITFIQFLLVSLHGLRHFVIWTPYPRLKPRRIPLPPILLQVLLFYCLSLLNNLAFRFSIPMPVHIIFRSGGLVISMLLGSLLLDRKYNPMQIASVFVVTIGVVLTTLSASGRGDAQPRNSLGAQQWNIEEYLTGISLLTVALFMGGLLGIVQDRTYERFIHNARDAAGKSIEKPWEESMFYLHFLSLPFFAFVWPDIAEQLRDISAGPRYQLSQISSLVLLPVGASSLETYLVKASEMTIPKIYIPVLLNTVTQLLCVAGVNRLTSKVSSLTVTLVLVVRKAVSLIISVLIFDTVGRTRLNGQAKTMLYFGALLVFVGTVGYSLGTQRMKHEKKSEKVKQD